MQSEITSIKLEHTHIIRHPYQARQARQAWQSDAAYFTSLGSKSKNYACINKHKLSLIMIERVKESKKRESLGRLKIQFGLTDEKSFDNILIFEQISEFCR